MADKEKSEHERYRDERSFWNEYRKIQQARGINIDQVLAEWAAKEAQELPSPGAREDFDELCNHCCNREVLAVIVAVLRDSPRLETTWAMIVGPTENRQKATRSLEKAALTLEEIFGAVIAVEDDKDSAELAKIGRI